MARRAISAKFQSTGAFSSFFQKFQFLPKLSKNLKNSILWVLGEVIFHFSPWKYLFSILGP